ncbi:hypothetical protein TTW89_002675, partial [Acinetobacter baumannii]|nr:hypothetical protein [Acinetobacter baumannii]ELZ2207424.1 hypothetical protein [Acinetobacter baumannii]
IKVKDEAESKEAQELFFELGYEWRDSKRDITNLDVVFIYAKDGVLTAGFNDHNFAEAGHKELTLPQLRDLVVLKRGDVKDATHTDGHYKNIAWFRNSSGGYHQFDAKTNKWSGEYPITYVSACNLEEINKDPALISGADVPALIKQGESVQFRSVFNVQGGGEWKDLDLERDEEEFSLGDLINTRFEWRLKPQTIKLELELPKPFEPEEDCHVYILDDGKTDGYRRYSYEVHGDKGNTFIGIWKTEDEIKQVVEQLRKIRGAS